MLTVSADFTSTSLTPTLSPPAGSGPRFMATPFPRLCWKLMWLWQRPHPKHKHTPQTPEACFLVTNPSGQEGKDGHPDLATSPQGHQGGCSTYTKVTRHQVAVTELIFTTVFRQVAGKCPENGAPFSFLFLSFSIYY